MSFYGVEFVHVLAADTSVHQLPGEPDRESPVDGHLLTFPAGLSHLDCSGRNRFIRLPLLDNYRITNTSAISFQNTVMVGDLAGLPGLMG